MNARAAQTQARETAHRAYRQSVTEGALQANRRFQGALRECWREIGDPAKQRDAAEKLVRENDGYGEEPFLSGDSVFDRATRLAADARHKATFGVFGSAADAVVDELTVHVAFDWVKRIDRLSAILQKAAEGYIFDSMEARTLATQMLEPLETEIGRFDWFGSVKDQNRFRLESSVVRSSQPETEPGGSAA